MFHVHRHIPHPSQPLLPTQRSRKRLLIPLAGLVLACGSCTSTSPKPAPVPTIETKPIGDGLKLIGWALLGGTIVLVLGSMIKR